MQSIKELKKVCRKGKFDPFWISNILGRPISIYITWLSIKLGISANQITFISCCFALSSSFVLLWGTKYAMLASAICIYLFYVLDHVDGELARYANHVSPSSKHLDLSGKYFDRIVHYFLGITLYPCLGISLYFLYGDIIWLILGVLGAIGSSGLPRFTTAFTVFEVVSKRDELIKENYVKQFAEFDSVYWREEEIPGGFIIVPTNKFELKYVLKQYLSFPGDIITYIIFVLLDVFLFYPELVFIKVYLVFFASIRFINIMYSAYRYFKKLKKLPS